MRQEEFEKSVANAVPNTKGDDSATSAPDSPISPPETPPVPTGGGATGHEHETVWNRRAFKTCLLTALAGALTAAILYAASLCARLGDPPLPPVLVDVPASEWVAETDPTFHVIVTQSEAWVFHGDSAWRIEEMERGQLGLWCRSVCAIVAPVRVARVSSVDPAKPNRLRVELPVNGKMEERILVRSR